jgi:hypothetical protein
MSTALALVAPSELSPAEASESSVRKAEHASHTRARAAAASPFVFGDSTPFPHDWSCLVAMKEAIVAAVGLVAVQHALQRARERAKEIEHRIATDRARLIAVAESVERTLLIETKGATSLVVRTATRIVASAKQCAEGEALAAELEAETEIAHLREGAIEARAHGMHALQMFLSKNDLPGTHLGFRLVAKEAGYGVEALISTSFGANAVFELSIPESNPWSRARRVVDVAPDTFINLPREAGWFSKRVEMARLTLDKLYVLAASGDGDRGMMILGRSQRAGAGYELEIDASCEPPRVVLAELDDQGNELSPAPLSLDREDRQRILNLWKRLRESLTEVLTRRTTLVSSTFDERPLENQEPQIVAKRLIDTIAPLFVEIAQRSGAPGELVLRRNVRTGRREEVYVTKAELAERVLTLPPQFRAPFDVLELDGPRSPRAPQPSFAMYEDVSEELLDV